MSTSQFPVPTTTTTTQQFVPHFQQPTLQSIQPQFPQPQQPPNRNRGGRKVSANEIQYVQTLIEKCLQQYMDRAEVIDTLKRQINIDSRFTELVWQKLEQQNPEFLKAYNIRLRIKEQITAFNFLVSQQAQTMQNNSQRIPNNLPIQTFPTQQITTTSPPTTSLIPPSPDLTSSISTTISPSQVYSSQVPLPVYSSPINMSPSHLKFENNLQMSPNSFRSQTSSEMQYPSLSPPQSYSYPSSIYYENPSILQPSIDPLNNDQTSKDLTCLSSLPDEEIPWDPSLFFEV